MRVCLIFLLLLGLSPAWADEASGRDDTIYRTTDKNGNVVFTDNPADKSRAEPVRLREPNTVPMKAPLPVGEPKAADDKQQPAFQGYQRLAITSPEDQATVRNPSSPVPVRISLEPALRDGHRLVVLDNGTPLQGQALENPNRGSHTLQVEVRDASGASVARSEPVVIYVHRTSVSQQGRASGGSGVATYGAPARLGSPASVGGAARFGAPATTGPPATPGRAATPSSVGGASSSSSSSSSSR
ncbi:DUF4124 domain-containing protein [Alloalcanivorax mobilis]|uniref:DUF4124 domain-containing protein n=1 Tax=Alloalcanivorax mobilis TaxID=2019569 RepID=UPI0018E4BAA4|nr:DUF4124 domain-containing protein [Alloalcanivorax mobilis]